MSDLNLEIKNVIKNATGIEILDNDADFANDYQMDSVTRMELLMSLEESFEITIDEKEAVNLTSVNKTAEFINSVKSKG